MTDRGVPLPGSDPARRAEIHEALEAEKPYYAKHREVEQRQKNERGVSESDVEYYRNLWRRKP